MNITHVMNLVSLLMIVVKLALFGIVDTVRTPRRCGTGMSHTWMMRRYERTDCLPKPGNVTETDFPTFTLSFI